MALSTYVKTQINGVLIHHSIDDIYLDNFYIQNKSLYTYEELLNYLVELYDKKTSMQRSNKILAKIIRSINLIVNECIDSIISNDLYVSLVNFKAKYDKYLQNNNLKSDDVITSELDVLEELLSKIKVEKNNDVGLQMTDFANKIANLENELNDKNNQLQEKNDQFDKTKKELKLLKSELRKIKKENSNNIKTTKKQEDIIKKQENRVKTLEQQISEQKSKEDILNNQVAELNCQNINLSNQNTNYSKTIDLQSQKLVKLKKELKEYRNQIGKLDTINNQKNRDKNIDEAILMLILDNDNTFEQFQRSLKAVVGNVSFDEINTSIKRLKSRYSFATSMDANLNSVYKLSTPNYNTNISINFEVDNSIDIIAISDLHMTDFSGEKIKNINYIYDYAVKNGIKTIINLGDLFDFKSFNSSLQYNDFRKNNDMIDSAIKLMPYDKSINHLILGGNHDKLILGVDAIKTLCDERRDFIDLGYDHAKLILGNDTIYLHHIDSKFDETNKNLLISLRRYYEKMGESRKKTYLDLLGHVHKSLLSLSDGFALIPSLNADRFCNGAWHLKVYFDKNKNISNIIFIPLIFHPQVQTNTEIVYKKLKKQ